MASPSYAEFPIRPPGATSAAAGAESRAVKTRVPLLCLAIALLLGACEGGGGDEPDLPPTPGGTQTTPGPSVYAASVPTPKGWREYTYPSIGLRFAYPPLPGSVAENSRAADGVRHSWIIRRTDRCNPRGECRAYEFAAVNDGCPESAPWPTFAHRWIETQTAHTISTCAGKDSFPLKKALRTVERPDGLRGIVYDANVWFGDARVPGAIAAVLNFPAAYHDRYEAVAFYFDDPISLDTVETLLKTVTLTG